MNERIKELAEQATSSRNQYDPKTMMTERIQEFDKEKFAELIVKECCTAIKSTDRHRSEYFIAKLKEHFGVEE